LIQNGGRLSKMEEMPYEKELDLQRLLADYPDLLAGEQIDSASPRQWLLISREVALPSEEDGPARWSVDHLFVDQDAIPTIIETKRGSNAQIRREIVGQVLEYAANAVLYWPIDVLRENFRDRCKDIGQDPDQVLTQFIDGAVDNDEFWRRMESNLRSGRVRLLFMADKIPETLVRIVEFLNEQMRDAEVLAIEIRQFVSEEHKALVPRVLGQTEEAKAMKTSVSLPKQDEKSFLDNLNERNKPLHQAMLSLKGTDGFRFNWTPRGYSMSFLGGKRPVMLFQGNLKYGNFDERGYTTFWNLRERIPGSEDLIRRYGERLIATGIFERTTNPAEVRSKLDVNIGEEEGKEVVKIFKDLGDELANRL